MTGPTGPLPGGSIHRSPRLDDLQSLQSFTRAGERSGEGTEVDPHLLTEGSGFI